ncbi:unnamed protein product, partial [Ilex paraguariensis]
ENKSYHGDRRHDKVPSSDDDIESIENIQQAYDQLVEEFLKQKNRQCAEHKARKNEDEKQELHLNLVKCKVHNCGLEEDIKSMKDKLSFLDSECYGIVECKKSLIKHDKDLHESQELYKRLS